jgi:hypothetical protein
VARVLDQAKRSQTPVMEKLFTERVDAEPTPREVTKGRASTRRHGGALMQNDKWLTFVFGLVVVVALVIIGTKL